MREGKSLPMAIEEPKRIAFAFPYGRAFMEKVVEGIIDCARQEMNWRFTRFPERLSPSLDWLRGWKGDGAFVTIASEEDVEIARALPFPVVNLTAYYSCDGVSTVTADHRLIGRMAAGHLLERRFQKFGYYGAKELYYSQLRKEGFVAAVRKEGADCSCLEVSHRVDSMQTWVEQERELEQWLFSLQPPVGVMASNDLRAGMLMELCRRAGLQVPGQIAVIGVDNDPVVAAHTHPSLSSVARDDHEAGRVAARQLMALMDGSISPGELRYIPPAGVVARQSTEILAIEDPELRSVIKRMREQIGERFGVERLLELTGWSRRRLETRFQEQIGEAPYSFINRLRVEVARRLLKQQPGQPLSRVAEACGFSDLRHFRLAFRRFTGQTPGQYRGLRKENTNA